MDRPLTKIFFLKALAAVCLATSPLLSSAAEKKVLRMGIHPLYNPQKIVEIFGPLCDLMTSKTSFQCVLEPSRGYSQFNSQIKVKYFDLIMPNPFQGWKSLSYGYELFGKWSNDELFRGLILVRKDSNIKNLEELKGKKISFPAPTALAATLIPQLALAEKGIFPDKDYQALFVGSQDSAILSVFNSHTQAGVTWHPPWNLSQMERPEFKAELQVLYETESFPSNALAYKKNLLSKDKEEIKKFLLDLHESTEGRAILSRIGIDRFESASKKTYLKIESFIKRYEKKLGAIPW